MKAGMILGIIGGVIALLIGAIGYSFTSGLESLGNSAHSFNQSMGVNNPKPPSLALYSYASIILPIIALVGSGIVNRSWKWAVGLMSVSAVLMLFVFGIGFLSLTPAILLLVGSFLVFNEAWKSKKA